MAHSVAQYIQICSFIYTFIREITCTSSLAVLSSMRGEGEGGSRGWFVTSHARFAAAPARATPCHWLVT